jgi:hypothetical protein
MTTIYNSESTVANSTRRSYISVDSFDGDIFSYTTSLDANLVYQGVLGAVTGATSITCPKGRVLRETGKRLIPGADVGVSTYMVGVYDAVSGLNGYIDPNGHVFAPYNGDKPTVMADGVDPHIGGKDLGAPVYTVNSIEAGTTLKIGQTAQIGSSLSTGTFVTAGTSVTAGTILTGGLFASSLTTANGGGGTNFNLYVNGSNANSFVFNLTPAVGAGTAYVYFGTGASAPNKVVPPAGTQINLVVQNHTGNSKIINFNNVYSSVIGQGNPTIGCNVAIAFTFVSDGTYLWETARTGTYGA